MTNPNQTICMLLLLADVGLKQQLYIRLQRYCYFPRMETRQNIGMDHHTYMLQPALQDGDRPVFSVSSSRRVPISLSSSLFPISLQQELSLSLTLPDRHVKPIPYASANTPYSFESSVCMLLGRCLCPLTSHTRQRGR